MNEGALYALAQVAMTLAGFSGFAAAFRLRGKNAWLPTELRVLWFLIIDSFLVVFLALLPVGLHIWGLKPDIIWAVCSPLLALWFIIGSFIAFQGERRERAMRQHTTVPIASLPIYGINVLAGIVVVSILLSTFDVLIPRGQGPYVVGLITLMMFAAAEFLFFIGQASARPSDP